MDNNEFIEIKKMLKQNIEMNQDIQTRIAKLENYVKWQKIGTVLKTLIIIIPLILSIIYLPPLLKNLFGSYQELLSPSQQIPLDYKSLGL